MECIHATFGSSVTDDLPSQQEAAYAAYGSEHYYAVLYKDKSGPAYGVGTTKEEAWRDAHKWLEFEDGDDNVRLFEISAVSYLKIKAGDPDAVELLEYRFPGEGIGM